MAAAELYEYLIQVLFTLTGRKAGIYLGPASMQSDQEMNFSAQAEPLGQTKRVNQESALLLSKRYLVYTNRLHRK